MTAIQTLVQQAKAIHEKHFPAETWFERALFFSWGCTIGDCTFCYMSTQPDSKKPTETKRSTASIYAETILAKHCGWEIGFFTGGIGVYTPSEMEAMLKTITGILGKKIWLSVGPVAKPILEKFLPYIKGVVGSLETVNPVLHKEVCPSKPMPPYLKMFEVAADLGLERGMTFIVGLGETRDDLVLLKELIEKYGISKIHVYGLIPQAGTPFEGKPIPSAEEQAWWIAQLRIAFPTLDIQCGIWEDRIERLPLLLEAGSNSISKLKATKLFGTKLCQEIEEIVTVAGRTFTGTLTTLPDVDWDAEVEKLTIDDSQKVWVRQKLQTYLKGIQKNLRKEQLVQIGKK